MAITRGNFLQKALVGVGAVALGNYASMASDEEKPITRSYEVDFSGLLKRLKSLRPVEIDFSRFKFRELRREHFVLRFKGNVTTRDVAEYLAHLHKKDAGDRAVKIDYNGKVSFKNDQWKRKNDPYCEHTIHDDSLRCHLYSISREKGSKNEVWVHKYHATPEECGQLIQRIEQDCLGIEFGRQRVKQLKRAVNRVARKLRFGYRIFGAATEAAAA